MNDQTSTARWMRWGSWADLVRSEAADRRQERAELLEAEATRPELLAYLEEALKTETNEGVVTALLISLSSHTKTDPRALIDAFGRVYSTAERAIQDGLWRVARNSEVFMRRGPELERAFEASPDEAEQALILRMLGVLIESKEKFAICNRLLDGKPARAARELLEVWNRALREEKNANPAKASTIERVARERLLSALPFLPPGGRAYAIALLGRELFHEDALRSIEAALRDPDTPVRHAAIGWLSRFPAGEAARIAWDLLAVEPDQDLLWELASFLRVEQGADDAAIARALAQNPNRRAFAAVVHEKLRQGKGRRQRHGDWLTWADLLRRLWPGLPPECRDAIEEWPRIHQDQDPRLEWWSEIRARLSAADPATAALVGSALARPFHETIGAYDFEAVTGLRRRHPVTFKTLPLLRFGFLASASTRDGRRVTEIIDERHALTLDDALLAAERAFDERRDELAKVNHEVNELARELGRDLTSMMRARDFTLRDHPWDLGSHAERFRDLAHRHGELSTILDLYGHSSRFSILRRATEHLLPLLREAGCSFRGLPGPDGVLGEYSPLQQGITLFGPMIELAAADLESRVGPEAKNVPALLRTAVEIHALAHAHVHLSEDASGRIWEEPGRSSREYHEALAQLYTRHLVSRIAEPGLVKVLEEIERWLPEAYSAADLLERLDREEVRAYVIRRRLRPPKRTIEDVVAAVLDALPGYVSMIQGLMTPESSEDLHRSAGGAIAALEESLSDARRFTQAVEAFFGVIEGLPQANASIAPFVRGGWPDAEDLVWLCFEALTGGGGSAREPIRFAPSNASGPVDISSFSGLRHLRPKLRICRERLRALSRDFSSEQARSGSNEG
jgi:hypothetical protein